MKKLLLKTALVAAMTISLHAEADFDAVQNLIGNQKYEQAVLALQIIEKNHPKSAKVQYTLAQAQAGVGNLPAAKIALDRAIAINPTLDFVPAKQVTELAKTINSTRVIAPVEKESHWFLWLLGIAAVASGTAFVLKRRKEEAFIRPEPKTEAASTSEFSSTYTRTEDEPIRTKRPERSSTSNYYEQSMNRTKREPVTREVHHYHDNSNQNTGLGTVGNIAVAAGTAAAVSSMMNNNNHHDSYFDRGSDRSTNNSTLNETGSQYNAEPKYEEDTISRTWDEPKEEISSTWDEPKEEISRTWDSSSDNDTSSSWDSSSDNNSSSSWDE